MEHTKEYFTLETLGKFYTDAAKACSMQKWNGNYWAATSCGPNIGDCQSNYRPKPAPVVRYIIKFPDEFLTDQATSRQSFECKDDAEIWMVQMYKNNSNFKVIKLIEEV